MITSTAQLRSEIHRLAKWSQDGSVITCYLNVDGRVRPRAADYIAAFRLLAQSAEQQNEAAGLLDAALLADEMNRLTRRLEAFERHETRGIIFAISSPAGLFELIELAVPVEDQILIANHPDLVQLQAIESRSRRYGVALADDVRLRLLTYDVGILNELPGHIASQPPGRNRQRGWNISGSDSSTGGAATKWVAAGTHVDRHRVAEHRRHLREFAAAIGDFVRNERIDGLITCGPETAELENALSPSVRQHLAGRITRGVAASLEEIRLALRDVVDADQTRIEGELSAEIEDALARGEATSGVDAVLLSLAEGRTKEIVMSEERDVRPGYECANCHSVWAKTGPCMACGGVTREVADVIGCALNHALAKGVRAEVLDARHPLKGIGGVAAMMRVQVTV